MSCERRRRCRHDEGEMGEQPDEGRADGVQDLSLPFLFLLI